MENTSSLTPAVKQNNRIRLGFWESTFNWGNLTLMLLLTLAILGPFLYIVFGSLTESSYFRRYGVSISPAHWSLTSYGLLLGSTSKMIPAFNVTLLTTVLGTLLGLMITSSLAFVVSRKELPGHNLLVTMLFFTMIFNGGMVPFYLVINELGMINTIWSMVIPFISDAWFIFIMVKFFESIPQDLFDAAKIDGCSELVLYFRIVLPLSKPVLATIGLFFAVYFWNQWFWPMVFVQNSDIYPVQLVLRSILASMMPVINPNAAVQQARQLAEAPPAEVLRMAAIIVSILPIAIVYPFLQRYFVKGITLGSVKG